MNKGQRHIRIRDIITNNEIETQDDLVEHLKQQVIMLHRRLFRGILKSYIW